MHHSGPVRPVRGAPPHPWRAELLEPLHDLLLALLRVFQLVDIAGRGAGFHDLQRVRHHVAIGEGFLQDPAIHVRWDRKAHGMQTVGAMSWMAAPSMRRAGKRSAVCVVSGHSLSCISKAAQWEPCRVLRSIGYDVSEASITRRPSDCQPGIRRSGMAMQMSRKHESSAFSAQAEKLFEGL